MCVEVYDTLYPVLSLPPFWTLTLVLFEWFFLKSYNYFLFPPESPGPPFPESFFFLHYYTVEEFEDTRSFMVSLGLFYI